MTRVDRAIISLLVAVFAVAALATTMSTPAAPIAAESTPPGVTISPEPSSAEPAIYREGIVGQATSVTPLTATTMADRELVSLVFSGLVRLGADGSLVPDLAASWTVDKTGATWTFQLRPDATWQDGTPVTAADVVFTVRALQDPAYDGPDAASWREVTVTRVAARTVRFKLATPLGGFLQELTQPLLPQHLVGDIPVDALASSDFGRNPIGSGPFRLVSLTEQEADLVPVAAGSGASGTPAPTATPALTPAPTATPAPPGEAIQGIELHFFATPAALEAAYTAGALDAAVGLPAADAATLGSTAGSRLVRYPLTTLTAIVLNQRAGQPYRDATLRRALVEIVSRSAIIRDILGGLASEASSPIPPTSWAFNAAASKAVPFDRAGAAADLRKAGWRKIGTAWAPPGSKTPLKITVISVDTATNQVVRRTAATVVDSWKSFGFKVSFKTLQPADVATQLQAGSFSAAILDVNVGLDPDLYPLFASSQATSKGSNVIGVQDQALDAKLAAARAPGSIAARQKAYRSLQLYLSQAQLMPALFFRDEPVVLSNRVVGPTPNLLGGPGDRFWDVLTWRLASGR